jgi:hypothetical protein
MRRCRGRLAKGAALARRRKKMRALAETVSAPSAMQDTKALTAAEHGNELARRAQLEAMARLRAADRSRLGALSVFPASVPGGAGLRRLGSFRCRNGSLAPRERGAASFTRTQASVAAERRLRRSPVAALTGPWGCGASARCASPLGLPGTAQLGLPQAGRMC